MHREINKEMEKRKVRFENDSQSALLWLMSNRGEKLFDEYGKWCVHRYDSNTIDVCWISDEDEDAGTEEYETMSYDEFIEEFKDEVLVSK